jgi:hypothetical protein
MDLKAEIENKLHDYFSKAERAKAKQKKDGKNYTVYGHVINEYEARASELAWVLSLMEQNKYLSPQLKQTDVSGSAQCSCDWTQMGTRIRRFGCSIHG